MVLEWSAPIDLSTLSSGLIVEQLQPSLGWVELPTDEVVVGTRPGEEDPGEVVVMLRSGWPRGMSYRIRLGPQLADRLGRPLGRSREIQWSVPAATPENPEPKVAHDQTFPSESDSADAAADTVGGRFPGGQPRLFQGLLHDPVTGLAYARNRWYDPRNAAWLSEDPLGAVDSTNLYAFVGWQPTMGTDPLGQACPECNPAFLNPENAEVTEGDKQVTSTAIGFTPYLGEVHDYSQMVTGRDYVTGEEFGFGGQILAGVGLALPFVPARVTRAIGEGVGAAGRYLWRRGGEALSHLTRPWTELNVRIRDTEPPINPSSSSPPDVRHVTTSSGQTQSVLNGIDPKYLSPEGRFGRAFYVAEVPETAVFEVVHHGYTPTQSIRFTVDLDKAHVLDLTDPEIAKQWGYAGGRMTPETRALGRKAREAGYNAVRFPSERGAGANLAVLDDFNELLQPQMVAPVPPNR